MKAAAILALAALMLSPAAEARTHKPRLPGVHAPRIHEPRVSRKTFRTVRITRADGSVWTGYRDSLGTHLTGPDGRTIHCRKNIGPADIDVSCR